MVILRVACRNIGAYREVEWRPAQGLTSLAGRNLLTDGADSNGSGKTTLLNLIPLALFGPIGADDVTAGTPEYAWVELEFRTWDNDRYRVRRAYDPKGRGSTSLDFEEATFATTGPGRRRGTSSGRRAPKTVKSPPSAPSNTSSG